MDGRFTPVEQVFPMQDAGFVGGFNPYGSNQMNMNMPPTPGMPPQPPGAFKRRRPSAAPMDHHSRNGSRSTMDSSRHLSAVGSHAELTVVEEAEAITAGDEA